MELNYYIALAAALIPLFIGMLWYNKKLFGKTWMRVAELDEDKLNTGNMVFIFGLTYLFSLFIALTLYGMVIHQIGYQQILVFLPDFADENSELFQSYKEFLAEHGNNHRSFAHGLLHGTMAGFMFAFPIIAINAMFERRPWKYIWIHTGYWVISIGLMGATICALA